MNLYFSTQIPVIVWVLLSVAVVLATIHVVWRWWRTNTLWHHVTYTEEEREYADELPAVSIVVDAMNETHQLSQFLPLVLHQDYAAPYEVIVVVDSNAEATSDMLSEMKAHFTNLHITFAPYGSRSLSRKKLALMIGIKAAHHDIVLTTSANCRPTNEQWLHLMMRNFTPDTDIVLGYSHYRYRKDEKPGRYMRVYDTVTTGVQWLTSAINGNPYRGTSDNMAYRKHLFFNARGFAGSMDLQWGEDDVFLREIVSPGNTRVELAPESQLAVYYAELPHAHALLKLRRDFTSSLVRRTPFIANAVTSWVNWLRVGCLAAAIALAPLNTAVWAIVGVIAILTWLSMLLSFVRDCQVLQAPPLRLWVPVMTLWRPIYNMWYRLRGWRLRSSNYTSFYK